MNKHEKSAMTLAEVLIVLLIMGVIAVVILSIINKKTNILEAESQFKHGYALVSQLITFGEKEYGHVSTWGWSESDNVAMSEFIAKNIFSPELKIARYCGNNTNEGCFAPNATYMYLKGTPFKNLDGDGTIAKIKLMNGEIIGVQDLSNDCTTTVDTQCGTIYVDVNGERKPNQLGRDLFLFDVYSISGLAPSGKGQTAAILDSECSREGNGIYCSFRILKDGMKILYL